MPNVYYPTTQRETTLEPADDEPSDDEPSDDEIVRRAQGGDREAFAELIRRFERPALAIAFAVLADGEAAGDAVQDAFVRAWQKLADLRRPDRLGKQECVRCHFTVPGQQTAHYPSSSANQLALLALGQARVNPDQTRVNTTPAGCTRNAERKSTVTYLGVGVSPVPELLRRHVKLPAEMGLLVESVEADSPAKVAGVAPYDILEKINEQLLVNQEQFSALIRSYRPGTQITLALIRANQAQSLSVTLAEREVAAAEGASSQGVAFADFDNDGLADLLVANTLVANTILTPLINATSNSGAFADIDSSAAAQNPGAEPLQITYLGVQTSSPPPALAGQLKLPLGLFLLVDGVDSDSPAEAAGVRAADVVKQLDDQVLVNSEQLGVLIRGHQADDEVLLTLIREGRQTTLRAKLGQRDAPAANLRQYSLKSKWRLDSMLRPYTTVHHVERSDPSVLSRLLDAIELKGGPTGATSDEEFVRRVYLDLVGSAPTPEETQKFLDDARADKRQRLIDELLGRPDVFSKFKGVSSLEWSDAEHALHLTSQQSGGRYLIAKDQAGSVVFDGPVDTDDQRGQLPTALAAKLALMLRGIDRRQAPSDAQALLERVISISATEAGLKQVVDMLRKETGANIVLNAKALKAAGADLDAPLTFELRDVKLATALKTIASLIGGDRKAVGYTVVDDVIVISTK